MKAKEIQIGGTYLAKVSGKVVPVTVTQTRTQPLTGRDSWLCQNEITGRPIVVKSCQRFRAPVTRDGARI